MLSLLEVTALFGGAQGISDPETAIARAADVSDVQEVDAAELERYEALLRRPLPINRVGEVRLEDAGLFSAYQIAALADYRIRCGDILSATELAQVDGFTRERAKALRPFLDFSPREAESKERWKPSGELVWKPQKWKTHLELGNTLELSYSPSGSRNLSLSGGGSRLQWQLTLGDYRARFGQGLLLWNGFSTSGVTTLGGFARTGASGVVPSRSWSEGTALRGAAGQLHFGRWRASVFAAGGYAKDAGPLLVGAGLSRTFRNGQLGLTGYRKGLERAPDGTALRDGELKLSADFFWNHRGREYFGEAAFDALKRQTAFVGGLRWPLGGEGMRLALTGRYYPAAYGAPYAAALRAGSKTADETGLALGWEWGSPYKLKLTLIGDAALQGLGGEKRKRQLKLFQELGWQLDPAWRLELRATERFRDGAYTGTNGRGRAELRTDVKWQRGPWRQNLRLDAVRCVRTGFLSYIEQGYDDAKHRLWLRETFFFADRWADRVYAYERDAPGGFSVPAFYGRGLKLAALGGWKLRLLQKRLRLSLYGRASAQFYPFRGYQKKTRTDARVQVQLTF